MAGPFVLHLNAVRSHSTRTCNPPCSLKLDEGSRDRDSAVDFTDQLFVMKPSSNPAFQKKHPSYVTIIAEAKSGWHPTDLLNRRSGKTWPSPKELLIRLCGATLQGDWCIRQRSASAAKTVWEIRIAKPEDIDILQNVIGHDRLVPIEQNDACPCYGFDYRKADYANWGSILRTF